MKIAEGGESASPPKVATVGTPLSLSNKDTLSRDGSASLQADHATAKGQCWRPREMAGGANPQSQPIQQRDTVRGHPALSQLSVSTAVAHPCPRGRSRAQPAHPRLHPEEEDEKKNTKDYTIGLYMRRLHEE